MLLSDGFSGRIEIITFYEGQKVAIRAVTGMLDDSRSTTASQNFFELPKRAQGYLVEKMKRMYDNHQFGFDFVRLQAAPIEQKDPLAAVAQQNSSQHA